jgi:hypothetical protein
MEDLSPYQYLEIENAGVDVLPPTPSEVTRRTVLKTAAVLGAGACTTYKLLQLDTQIGDEVYGTSPVEVGVVPDLEAEKTFPRHFTIVGGGFGVFNIEGLALAVHPGLKGFGQTAYLKNSNGGLYLDQLKQSTLAFLEERGGEVVNLYGHSMNGMEMTEIGHFLLKNGVHVQAEFLDCTPEAKYDIRPGKRSGAEFLAMVDKYTEMLGVSGGPGTRFAMEMASRKLQGRMDWEQMIKEALAKTSPQNCSDKLLLDMAHYMCAFDGSEFGPDFPVTTVVGKLRPADWSADPTINNQTSLAGWRNHAFPQLSVHDIAVMGGGHANPGAAGAHYTESLRRFGQEMGLYDGTRPRSNNHPI